jgi:hypothetical protein
MDELKKSLRFSILESDIQKILEMVACGEDEPPNFEMVRGLYDDGTELWHDIQTIVSSISHSFELFTELVPFIEIYIDMCII